MLWTKKYEDKVNALVPLMPPFNKDGDIQEWLRLCDCFFAKYKINKKTLGTYRNVNQMKTMLIYTAIGLSDDEAELSAHGGLLEKGLSKHFRYSFKGARAFLCRYYKHYKQ
jgi:hypothetical protein